MVKPYRKKLERALERCNRQLLELKRECETYQVLESLGGFSITLMNVMGEMEIIWKNWKMGKHERRFWNFIFRSGVFYIYDLLDENYVMYTQHEEDGRFRVKLYCESGAVNLQRCLDKGCSAVFFSATLLPVGYYKRLLSGRADDYAIYAHTPFAPEQKRVLLGRDVSSRYTRRGPEEYGRIADYIDQVAQAKSWEIT